MIEIKDEGLCSGCGACTNACPKQCITLKENSEGFRYPFINREDCINCGLCEKACPYYNLYIKGDILNVPLVFTMQSKDDESLLRSASGGVFYELAKVVINKGGAVFGAVWGERTDEVYHTCAWTIDELTPMQGSKYLQSDINNCYTEAKSLLQKGVLVLFSGTPCQIAGLLTYLKKDYKNLLTCDLICHGVPSPMVLNKFLAEKSKRGKTPPIKRYYRDKKWGWKPVFFTFQYEGGEEKKVETRQNSYNELFCKFLAQTRLSCYTCKFTRQPRIADLTLGDYYVQKTAIDHEGTEVRPDNNKGLSLITVNTRQGLQWLEEIFDKTAYRQLQLHTVKTHCLFQPLVASVNPPQRERFFRLLKLGFSVDTAYYFLFEVAHKLKFKFRR